MRLPLSYILYSKAGGEEESGRYSYRKWAAAMVAAIIVITQKADGRYRRPLPAAGGGDGGGRYRNGRPLQLQATLPEAGSGRYKRPLQLQRCTGTGS
jgi:hypothetical protein